MQTWKELGGDRVAEEAFVFSHAHIINHTRLHNSTL